MGFAISGWSNFSAGAIFRLEQFSAGAISGGSNFRRELWHGLRRDSRWRPPSYDLQRPVRLSLAASRSCSFPGTARGQCFSLTHCTEPSPSRKKRSTGVSTGEILNAVSVVAAAASRPYVDRRGNRLRVERCDHIVSGPVFSIGARVVHRRGEGQKPQPPS